MEKIIESLKLIKNAGLYPDTKIIEGCATDPEVIIEGRKVLLFCSNNYLGLANNELLKSEAIKAIKKYGIGSGGSRLISGNTNIQIELEKKLAQFKDTEDAITFATGYMANSGVIPAIMNPISLSPVQYIKDKFLNRKKIILSDALNHASIIDGCRLSKAQKVIYKHNDVNDLEKKLRKYKRNRKLIVTEGVFSMEGDIASIPEIVELAHKYNAIVMIDDAHATGVLGEHGGGTLDYFGIDSGEVDIIMGTFTKAIGAIGGFIAGSKELIEYLRIAAKTYMFTAPITPANVAAIISAITEIQSNKEIRNRLWENTNYLRGKLRSKGFNTLNSETPIIPVLIGEEKKAIEAAKELFKNDIFAPCIRWPAVPKNQSRIRLTVMSTHTTEQIDYLVSTLAKLGKKLDIIP